MENIITNFKIITNIKIKEAKHYQQREMKKKGKITSNEKIIENCDADYVKERPKTTDNCYLLNERIPLMNGKMSDSIKIYSYPESAYHRKQSNLILSS